MATEIELKAWADDPAALTARIAGLAGPGTAYVKDDAYWRPAPAGAGGADGLGSGVRIRRQGAEAIVTYKRKEVREGIEVNDEREFQVSDAGALEELLSRLGLAVWIRKRKTGTAWQLDGVTLELSLVDGLGWFAELEILAANDNPETVADARQRLLATLERIGIARERLEPRYYTEMLLAAGRAD